MENTYTLSQRQNQMLSFVDMSEVWIISSVNLTNKTGSLINLMGLHGCGVLGHEFSLTVLTEFRIFWGVIGMNDKKGKKLGLRKGFALCFFSLFVSCPFLSSLSPFLCAWFWDVGTESMLAGLFFIHGFRVFRMYTVVHIRDFELSTTLHYDFLFTS